MIEKTTAKNDLAKQYLAKYGLTAKGLARIWGVKVSAIYALCNNRARPLPSKNGSDMYIVAQRMGYYGDKVVPPYEAAGAPAAGRD